MGLFMAVVLYAHQGGWDEILLVAGPIAVIVWLLKIAEKRATAQRAANDAKPAAPPDES